MSISLDLASLSLDAIPFILTTKDRAWGQEIVWETHEIPRRHTNIKDEPVVQIPTQIQYWRGGEGAGSTARIPPFLRHNQLRTQHWAPACLIDAQGAWLGAAKGWHGRVQQAICRVVPFKGAQIHLRARPESTGATQHGKWRAGLYVAFWEL